MDHVQNTSGHGRQRVDGDDGQDHWQDDRERARRHTGEPDGNRPGSRHNSVPAPDSARRRAEWFAETGARITAIGAPATGNGLERYQPVRNFGLDELKRAERAERAGLGEVEADRSGIEWIDIEARGLRGARELTKRLDQLRPDLVHLDPGWLVAGATATRLLRIPSVVVSIDDTTATEVLARPGLRKLLSVLLTGPNSRAIFATEATSHRCVTAGLVRPGRALVIAGELPNERQRTLDVYAACLGHPPVTLTTG